MADPRRPRGVRLRPHRARRGLPPHRHRARLRQRGERRARGPRQRRRPRRDLHHHEAARRDQGRGRRPARVREVAAGARPRRRRPLPDPRAVAVERDRHRPHAPATSRSGRSSRSCYADGRTRSIGVSNFSVDDLESAHRRDRRRAAREPDPLVRRQHPGRRHRLVPGSAACSSRATPRSRPVSCSRAARSTTSRTRVGRTPAQVAIRYLLEKGVLPLPKSVTPEAHRGERRGRLHPRRGRRSRRSTPSPTEPVFTDTAPGRSAPAPSSVNSRDRGGGRGRAAGGGCPPRIAGCSKSSAGSGVMPIRAHHGLRPHVRGRGERDELVELEVLERRPRARRGPPRSRSRAPRRRGAAASRSRSPAGTAPRSPGTFRPVKPMNRPVAELLHRPEAPAAALEQRADAVDERVRLGAGQRARGSAP